MKEYNLNSFQKTAWSFAVIKNNKLIYRSKKEGLKPLLFCLKNKQIILKGATVYDKIIGRAAAFLIIHGQVKNVMTPTISRTALKEFKKYKIKVDYATVTGKIMNKRGDDICPMEKLSRNKKPEQFARIMLEK